MAQKENSINSRGRRGILIILSILVLGLIIFFLYWYFYLKNYVFTDDAYVVADNAYISSRIPGTIETLLVHNDDYVKKGDLLIKLDPSIYKTKLNRIEEELKVVLYQLNSSYKELDILKYNLKKQTSISKNNIKLLLAEQKRLNFEIKSLSSKKDVLLKDLHLAQIEYKRYLNLYKRHSISRDKFDRVKTIRDKLVCEISSIGFQIKSLKASLSSLKEKINNARIQQEIVHKDLEKIAVTEEKIRSLEAKRDAMRAAVKEAQLTLGYTHITAPISGYIAGCKLQVGDRVMPGQPLMIIVPLKRVYVEANFKETQLKDVCIGQKVEIKADMYPGHIFYGHVAGIRAGTGSAFSLLPPENASGNWIKVVQRVPVKIELNHPFSPQYPLRVGCSLEVRIDIRKKTGPRLRGLK